MLISKRKKIFTLIIILFLFGLLVCAYIVISPLYVKYAARHKIFTRVENIESRDFVIILGAGIRNNKTPGSYLQKRLDDAVTLYREQKVEKILITGDNGQKLHDEISVMNNYLLKNGIPQDVIFADYAGFDTYSSMERADKLFSIENAIVISQYYHLPRAVYIARNKGIDAIGFTSHPHYGKRIYKVIEWLATAKSVFDCMINRKAKFYGKKINTKGNSNVVLDQL